MQVTFRVLSCVTSSFHCRVPHALPALSQVLNVSPEHPAVLLSLRQVQCQRLLVASGGAVLPDSVLEQLNNAVMMNPTNLGAWHVSEQLHHLRQYFVLQ